MNEQDIQSLRWLTRLDGRESPADRDAFERWLLQPGTAPAHERMEHFWDQDLALLRNHPGFSRLSNEALRPRRSPVALALAASVVIGVLGAAAFVAGHYYMPARTYVTEMGQRSTVRLDDGSEVILNSSTRLKVKLTDRRREFVLKQGEAIFRVAEDMRRPFTVEAGNGRVTALGTRFQVRNESNQVTVTLLEGRVALDRSEHGEPVQLNPGDQVRFGIGGGSLSRRTVDPAMASSWALGYLEFKVTPLSEVLEEVNRYSQIKLRLRDPELARKPLSGAFELGDTESVVAALQTLLQVQTTARGGDEIVLSRQPGGK